jgi:hypothetical protein
VIDRDKVSADLESITTIKTFITQAPGGNGMKLFTTVIYKCS